MYLREIVWGGMDLIHVAQDKGVAGSELNIVHVMEMFINALRNMSSIVGS
jgi:hypothetical protein